MAEEQNIDPELEALFGKPGDGILKAQLPSKGKGYRNCDGYIEVRPMTFEDEKELSNLGGEDVIDFLIERCVTGVDVQDLYIQDKLFVLYKLREASFGTEVELVSTCAVCGHKNTIGVDLAQLPIDFVDEDFTGKKTIKLPSIDKEAEVRIATNQDARYLLTRDSILDNLWRFVDRIDTIKDRSKISKAIKMMKSPDVRALVSAINSDDFGIQTQAIYYCSKEGCGAENVSNIPITQDFFTMR